MNWSEAAGWNGRELLFAARGAETFMEHQEALHIHAAERYLLGELEGPEREAFEEHFFDCQECSEAVTANAMLADNSRAVFRQREQRRALEAAARRSGRLRDWLALPRLVPALAAMALLVVAGYQQMVTIPGLRQQLTQSNAVQPVAAFALHAESRGAAQVIQAPRGAKHFTIFIDLPAESAPSYQCDILDAAGAVRASVQVTRPPAGDTLDLLLDPARFPAGEYTLVVGNAAAPAGEIGRYAFALQYK